MLIICLRSFRLTKNVLIIYSHLTWSCPIKAHIKQYANRIIRYKQESQLTDQVLVLDLAWTSQLVSSEIQLKTDRVKMLKAMVKRALKKEEESQEESAAVLIAKTFLRIDVGILPCFPNC